MSWWKLVVVVIVVVLHTFLKIFPNKTTKRQVKACSRSDDGKIGHLKLAHKTLAGFYATFVNFGLYLPLNGSKDNYIDTIHVDGQGGHQQN